MIRIFRCGKDGVLISNDIMEGSGLVNSCPKFWKLEKVLVCLIGCGFVLIIIASWIAYAHLCAHPDTLRGLKLAEIFLFALGMTVMFIPLTGLMYMDFSDKN
jgi:hypothetical protein